MKETVIRKLEGLMERYEEVQALLGEPDVVSDQEKFRSLTKEYAQLGEVVASFRRYQQAEADLQAIEEMLAGDDAEMGKLIEIITRHGKANKGILNVRAIYEAARKVKPFVGQAGVMKRMETQLLPMLEERNYICVINGVVFVNPTLLG